MMNITHTHVTHLVRIDIVAISILILSFNPGYWICIHNIKEIKKILNSQHLYTNSTNHAMERMNQISDYLKCKSCQIDTKTKAVKNTELIITFNS